VVENPKEGPSREIPLPTKPKEQIHVMSVARRAVKDTRKDQEKGRGKAGSMEEKSERSEEITQPTPSFFITLRLSRRTVEICMTMPRNVLNSGRRCRMRIRPSIDDNTARTLRNGRWRTPERATLVDLNPSLLQKLVDVEVVVVAVNRNNNLILLISVWMNV
jgi:hypothetical protein